MRAADDLKVKACFFEWESFLYYEIHDVSDCGPRGSGIEGLSRDLVSDPEVTLSFRLPSKTDPATVRNEKLVPENMVFEIYFAWVAFCTYDLQ